VALGKQMDIVEKFRVQSKKRIINTVLALMFWIPALAISYYDLTFSFIPMRMDYFDLILKALGLVFIVLAYRNSLCPKCDSIAGNGWAVDECKSCGVKLT
jgi:hypothetical protein